MTGHDMPNRKEGKMSAALFCDWDVSGGNPESTSLLELDNLTDCKILFFDPLHFAKNNDLRKNLSDLWVRENISFTDITFQQFLAKYKKAFDSIKQFISSGGIIIIRSNLPNSQITVRKKSSSSSGRYVESLISPFFWLEEYIGKFSFQYGKESKLRIHDERSPFYAEFNNIPIKSIQTLGIVSKGDTEVLADNGKQNRLPIISRIHFKEEKGEIYFIPRFLVENENEKLVKTFAAIIQDKEARSSLPEWIDHYKRELSLADPYAPEIDRISTEIKQLVKKRESLLSKQEKIHCYTELLYKTGPELIQIAKKTFNMAGFYFPDPPQAFEKAGFDFYLRDKSAPHIIGKVLSSENGAIPLSAYEELIEQIENCGFSEQPKVFLIANAAANRPPSERRYWFEKDIIKKNNKHEFCLITTLQLFDVACYLLGKDNSATANAVKESIRKDFLNCESIFEFNQKKYYARVKS